jgi:polysaccharide deacetylase family protein (PEP-CTERM system associated)
MEPAADRPAPALVNAMSVDVEDYYQVSAFAGSIARSDWPRFPSRVEDNTARVLDLFAAGGVKATFFVLGCIARQRPRLVRSIVEAGHELASHGLAHFRVGEQDRPTFARDVAGAKEILEQAGGVAVRGYRAASFSIGPETWWAYDVLAEAGYAYSSSIHPIRHDHYGLPEAPRFAFRPAAGGPVEIPVGTIERFGRRFSCAGGGFFRLLPYAWTAGGMRRVNAGEGRPVTFYFHPWEIDPGQPRVSSAPAGRRFRHYVNLGVMERKLARLLLDFAWAPMAEVYAAEMDGDGAAAAPSWRPRAARDG